MIPNLQSAIFRKYFDDVIKNHMEGPTGFKVLLKPLVDAKQVTITQTEVRFQNGSLISLEHLGLAKDLEKQQGRERHVLVIDEATQILEQYIRFLRGWVRMSEEVKRTIPKELAGQFPRIIYTANPIGISVPFFRKTFVLSRPAMTIEKASDDEGGFLQQYIPSRVEDNYSVNAKDQRARLAGLGDKARAKALIEGDWTAPLGDYFNVWDEARHVVPDFNPPAHWFRFRGFDWGSAEPFAVLWAAVSDGQEFEQDGKEIWLPRGSIVIYKEWYGCDPEKPAKGLGYKNEDIAYGIVKRSEDCKNNIYTLTDSFPFRELGGPSIASVFAQHGVVLSRADTSRVTGWSLMRDRLIGSNEGLPMLYVCESVRYLREYIPILPRNERNPEDAAEDGEATHVTDACRYIVASFTKIEDAKKEPDYSMQVTKPTFQQLIDFNNRIKTSGSY